jgi:hypothetical protein
MHNPLTVLHAKNTIQGTVYNNVDWIFNAKAKHTHTLIQYIYCDVLPKSLKAGISEAALFTRQRARRTVTTQRTSAT